MPAESTVNQQRAKLKPQALKEVFHRFNFLVPPKVQDGCDLIAADGSTFTFLANQNLYQKGILQKSTSTPFTTSGQIPI